jgi:hypothetical protein
MRAFCRENKGTVLIEAAGYTRQKLTPDRWCGIDELLLRQPYIEGVRPYQHGERVSLNLNDFRAKMLFFMRAGIGKNKHLTHWMCETHGIPVSCMDQPWITITDPSKIAPVVFSRAGAGRPAHAVYQNPTFPWGCAWQKYHKNAVFIGTVEEHAHFEQACGKTPHYVTKNLLEAAQVIAGAELFVGNQTATHAIAEGLKKRIVLEVWREGPNCLVYRDGVIHGWDQFLKLPEL